MMPHLVGFATENFTSQVSRSYDMVKNQSQRDMVVARLFPSRNTHP